MPIFRSLTRYALPVAAVAVLSLATYRATQAADHFDSPPRTDPLVDPIPDFAADIADVFVFHTDTAVVIALTFAGPQPKDRPPIYDRNVLYTINVSTSGDRHVPEYVMEFRFGFDASNNVGIQATGLPGASTLVGPIEQNLSTPNGIMVRAGLFDDPFTFDLQGFRETRAMDTLRFDNRRNFFNEQNDTTIVVQIPRSLLPSNVIDVWATSARFGGQI